MKFSIIIANYNYERFVGKAIDSALAIRWPDVEVIVVDDGSTDQSRQVIAAYGDRVLPILQKNAGQLIACNVGFAKATGDWIIFLDADDLLDPSIAEEVARVSTPRTSKVQFLMERIDSDGRPTGSCFPTYTPPPTPEKISDWAVRLTTYSTPPGSGNVYARAFLDKIFPLDNACGDAPDSELVTAAPFFGDVVTVEKPLVKYRVHGGNDSNLFAKEGQFAREVARGYARFLYSQRIAQTVGIDIPDATFRKNLHVLQHRIPSVTLSPALHPLPWDNKYQVLKDTLTTTFTFDAMSRKHRVVLLAWSILTLLAPKPIARKLIQLRFSH
ncbi:glycosyltransferase family A protein [Asticcacaulis sp.]|uniref:glycosyltransferase family 2 protein n=1 Tax=Asticcacaulis sp. TaxID=1872648 RepID=UPI002CD10260|nr:glycosyltransferase family A protein [Asticcacaulis sp.]HTM82624.1 glycosyltransferase family A protein [Asticcacaulis sp.]